MRIIKSKEKKENRTHRHCNSNSKSSMELSDTQVSSEINMQPALHSCP